MGIRSARSHPTTRPLPLPQTLPEVYCMLGGLILLIRETSHTSCRVYSWGDRASRVRAKRASLPEAPPTLLLKSERRSGSGVTRRGSGSGRLLIQAEGRHLVTGGRGVQGLPHARSLVGTAPMHRAPPSHECTLPAMDRVSGVEEFEGTGHRSEGRTGGNEGQRGVTEELVLYNWGRPHWGQKVDDTHSQASSINA